MNRSIRILAISVLAAIAVLAAGVTWQQAVAGPGYRDDPRNLRTIEDQADQKRGRILSADGVLLARSLRQEDGTYLRTYPRGDLYGHVTGYSAPRFPDLGIEAARAEDLLTRNDGSLESVLSRWLGIDLRPHDLQLTIRDDLQQAAAEALGGQRGAVVVLDPETGAVLALVSSPTFDPNEFTDPGFTGIRPGESSAIAKTYAPGSSFKVIVAAAGLEAAVVTPETLLPDSRELELPNSTATISNSDGGFCGNGETVSLEHAVVISCNTAFGALGMELGSGAVVDSAAAAGFNRVIPFDLPTIASVIPDADALDSAALAQTSLGQRDVRATPLQMALIAAGIANGGVIMEPYLVGAVLDADGEIVESPEPAVFTRFTTATAASDLSAMMEQVVLSGTGWRAAVPGLTVAGKTGTAEVPGGAPHVWVIGFASDPDDPAAGSIALAVLVESGGDRGEEGTGGSVAAPIAEKVFRAWGEG